MTRKAMVAIAGAVIALAACGGDTATPTTGAPAPTTSTTEAIPTPTEASTTTEAPTTTSEAPAPTVATTGQFITTAQTGLGEILIDEDGHALYLFLPDDQGPSTCTGNCAGTWPPVVLIGDTMPAGAGIDASLLGTVERDDGSIQATYNGWPLYTFFNDNDTDGQGIGGNWWVVSPTGDPIM